VPLERVGGDKNDQNILATDISPFLTHGGYGQLTGRNSVLSGENHTNLVGFNGPGSVGCQSTGRGVRGRQHPTTGCGGLPMRRNGYIVVLLVVMTLLPMWYVGVHGEPPAEEIAIDQSVTEMRPLAGFVDVPTKLSPSQVGVIVWVALFVLIGVLTVAHRFMNRAVRPGDGDRATAVAADGGSVGDPSGESSEQRADGGRVGLPWLATEDRWVVEYHDATEAVEGLVAMGGLTVLAVVFAALFTGEYLTLARTQYFGVYAAGMFLSLAGSTVAYYAWFMPHVEVAERRSH